MAGPDVGELLQMNRSQYPKSTQMTDKLAVPVTPASATMSEEPRIVSPNDEDAVDHNKVRRRRRHGSVSIQRERLREESEIDLARLTAKLEKLKAILAHRKTYSQKSRKASSKTELSDTSGSSNEWDEILDSVLHFFMASLAVLLITWVAVNVCRCLTVYLLPELFLECAVLPPTQTVEVAVGNTAVYDQRARTALAWQLLFGHHPCRPVYLETECVGHGSVK